MKKIVAVILITFSVIACSTGSKNEFVLHGEITGGFTDSTKVFLKVPDSLNRNLVDIDTALVIGGKFEFKGNQETPTMHYLIVDGLRANLPVIIEKGEIELIGQKDSLQFVSAVGTPQNDFLSEYSTLLCRIF